MNKISKVLIAILIQSFVSSAFAQEVATSQEIADCVTLQGKAAEHSKWSAALEELADNDKLSAAQMNRVAKAALNKIYEDIYSVRDLVGINEELTVLEQTPKLLKRVKSGSLETEKANELMLDKLNQLDRAMFDSLHEAGQSIPYCDVFAGRSRAVLQKSSTKSSDSSDSSDVVQ
jgi:hypothetical protein